MLKQRDGELITNVSFRNDKMNANTETEGWKLFCAKLEIEKHFLFSRVSAAQPARCDGVQREEHDPQVEGSHRRWWNAHHCLQH